MPELPEVESTVRYVRERCLERAITAVTVHWSRTIATPQPAIFCERLVGARINEVVRCGKYIALQLTKKVPLYLFVHLRMSGTLDVVSIDSEEDIHDRVVISLDDQRCIRFNDTRKFGRMYLCETPDPITKGLGIDPLSDKFTVDALGAILTRGRGRIKPLLLNQSLIAGLGNIYVDESLWRAGIHPLTSGCAVPLRKIHLLHTSIQETLLEAIELAGTDFGDGVVYGGMYRPRVYGRGGKKCLRCDGIIERLVVGQRGTHICTKCQRLKKMRPPPSDYE